MTRSVEFDHYPEIVENGQGIHRLELLGIKETLRSPNERRGFFAGMSNEDFTYMIGYVNSITRGQAIDYSYEDGHSPSGYTPPLEDKKLLMDLAFQTTRDILSDTTLDDGVALRRAGLTMAGASSYVHPKGDGNGRIGRVSHYLIEYGTERGDQAFNEEMYAIIAKTPVYDTDTKVALYDTPPGALDRALDAKLIEFQPDARHMSGRQYASARVVMFLDMMRGKTAIPVREDVASVQRLNADKTSYVEYIPAGTLDGRDVYELEYLRLSAIPNRSPGDIPESASRIMAAKPVSEPKKVNLGVEFID